MRTKILLVVLLVFNVMSCRHCPKPPPHDSWADVADFAAKHLVHQGKLMQNPDGYAYIKVDDAYIHELFPKLNADGFEKPPFFRRNDSPGAHISVVYKDEHVVLKEAGEIFDFTIKNIVTVSPKKNLRYIVLQVEAPKLEELRMRYGLAPKLKNHEFHITLAKSTTPQSR